MDERVKRLERVRATRVVVVVRGAKAHSLSGLAGELAQLGFDIFEVTMTTPGALESIAELRSAHPDILVGAGTVLDAEAARATLDAGAQFLVSPTLNRDVIEIAHEREALAMPGAFTPTEALEAWNSGADIVKVFPATVGGPAYIRALRAPLPQLRLLPTGGVNIDSAAEYLRCGAFAVCLGTSFVDPDALARGDLRGILKSAMQLTHNLAGVPLAP